MISVRAHTEICLEKIIGPLLIGDPRFIEEDVLVQHTELFRKVSRLLDDGHFRNTRVRVFGALEI